MANPPSENLETFPCEVCGRQFVKSSLLKHEPVCRKMTKSKRKVFDSGVQRATGSDITIANIEHARKEREKLGGTFPRPKTSWREKHETFVSAISASKQVNHALQTGAPLPPPPKASVPKDYVKCDYCGRNFNETAAQRHIPFCKTQTEKKAPMKVSSNTKKSIAASNKTSKPVSQGCKVESKKDHNSDERRSSFSSNRSEASRLSQVSNTAGNGSERRTERTHSKKRSSSAPRSSSKSRGHTNNNSSNRQQISSSASHRSSNREKTPVPVSRQSTGSRSGSKSSVKKRS